VTEDVPDLETRLAHLRQASRPKEPLTVGREPTAQGHILSAITKLERMIAALRR
jgi:hypothetical protein